MLKESGILTLPDNRTLRDYSNCFRAGIGFDSAYLDLDNKDFLSRCKPKACDSWIGIIHDEVSLRRELVFDDSSSLIGFLIWVPSRIQLIKMKSLFLPNGVLRQRKRPICICSCLWLSVFFFIGKCLLPFFKPLLLNHLLCSILFGSVLSGTTQGTAIYKTPNPYSEEKRLIFFICCPVHVLKTARNNWENSFWNN